MEQEECCILGICCDKKLRREALAEKLTRELELDPTLAATVADFIIDTYDLAPHGMLMPLVDYVAEEAREYPYQQK